MTVFLLILLMLALSAFFSGSEIAFVTANRLKTEARARQAGWVGRVVQEFMADPGTFLTTTLVDPPHLAMEEPSGARGRAARNHAK